MSCESITDIVVRESGRYMSDEIYRRVFARSPWAPGLLQRGRFPDAMGTTISNLTYERSAPLIAEPTWTQMTVTDGQEGGSCLPPATKVAIGSTSRTFSLYRRVLEGPDFCAEDLRYSFALADQLNRITDILAEYSLLEWEIRNRHEYFRQCKRKVVITNTCPPTDSFTYGTTTYPAVCPGGRFSLGIANRYKMKLLRDGAGASAMGRENNMPILTIVCSAETFESIKLENNERRQDLRWGAPSELLGPYGVGGSLWGYYWLIDPYPRRFTCSGGTFTEVPAFVSQSASKGNKAEINPAYETAPYEETLFFDRTVLTQLIPEPVVAPAPNYRFDPVTYTGLWSVKNILNRDCNPDGNILYHRGILAASSMPVHPERGVAFVHMRCDPACELIVQCGS